MNPQVRFARKPIVSALTAVWLGATAVIGDCAELAIAQSPLLVSTTVEPNVMLLMDNSGSMDNIIWADGFDSTPVTPYPDWSNGDENYVSTSGNNQLGRVSTGSCADGWQEGRSADGTTKCLRLPSPRGDSTRYTGAYLNYLFETYADGTDLTGGQIPQTTRLTVAKDAITDFVENVSGMRIGVSSFYPPADGNGAPGGKIDVECGASTSTIITAIAGLSANSNTPLSETLYEITRYFRGLSGYHTSSVEAYRSPIQYRCQKNFSVVVTDGLPTWDTSFPGTDPADVADTTRALPDWDGLHPDTTEAMYPNFPQYSDGFGANSGAQNQEAFSLYLDDVAKFAYDIDMKTSGTDAAGGSWQDPDFTQQNMQTYTIGFSIDTQMLRDAAEYGNGLYLQANNASQLTTALQSAMSHVFSASTSSSSVATNSTRLGTDTLLYQARFNTVRWSGEVLSFPIRSDGSIGGQSANAANNIPAHGSRIIYTYDPGAAAGTARGIPFQWTAGGTSLTLTQQAALNSVYGGAADGLGIQRVAYLRGDRSLEQQNDDPAVAGDGIFRNRTSAPLDTDDSDSPLGDIVNSDPHFVGTPDYRYHTLPGTEGTAYRTFRESASYRNRTPMLYVGANDGMLHAFNASGLTERFAYVPNATFTKLSALTSPNYTHTYFVDGSPKSGDAYINGGWKTVLVSGLGAGGKAVFALDITNPAGFSGDNVLWEFSDATNLGYTFSQPTIVRLNSGVWAAIFGNGYNSTAQTAQLFIVNLATGSEIARIDTGVGSLASPNGLSTPVPLDTNGDRITDYVYAGDLHGNLWKFDLTHASQTSRWSARALFQATDGSGTAQPITVRPEIGSLTDESGYMIYFGTGKYLETGDNTVPATPPIQTFYGIKDTGASNWSVARNQLQQQTILAEVSAFGQDLRAISTNALTSAHRGWYLNLVSPSGRQGERVVSNAVLRAGRIIFTTLIPDPDPCSYGGTSWLMELDAQTGARTLFSVFDLNGDGLFNTQDYIIVDGQQIPANGKKSQEGVIDTPAIVGAGEQEYKFASGSTGNIDTTVELGDAQSARQSWRQIK